MSDVTADMDGPSRRETIAVLLGILTFVVGDIFLQSLFVIFPLTGCQWVRVFLVSGLLLACLLTAIIVLFVPRPERQRK